MDPQFPSATVENIYDTYEVLIDTVTQALRPRTEDVIRLGEHRDSCFALMQRVTEIGSPSCLETTVC